MSTKPTMLSMSTVLTDLTKPAKSAQPKNQRWSPRGRPWPRGRPRGHILKSLALVSKVKSLALASRP